MHFAQTRYALLYEINAFLHNAPLHIGHVHDPAKPQIQ